MSVSNTTPSMSTTSPHYLSSLSVNNITSTMSTNSGKLALHPQAVFQASSNLALSASPSVAQTSAEQVNQTTASKPTMLPSTLQSGLPSTQRQIRTPGAIITISTPTRASISQPSKLAYGKHQLPVRPLPITSLPHVTPKSTITTTSTSLGDPGGGSVSKLTSAQPTILANTVPAKPKAAQHILMAPGLRTPTPSLKFQATYSPTYAYQLPNQAVTTASSSHPTINASTTRPAAPLVVRPVISAATTSRTFVPLTVAATTSEITRPTSVLYHPTSTISISIPAKPTSHPEMSARLSLSSSQGARSIYQVGLTQTSTPCASLAISSSKSQRPILSLQPGNAAAAKPNLTVPIQTSSTSSTSSSGFISTTRHSIAAITTSAVSVAKIFPPQPTTKVVTIHPSTTSSSGPTGSSEVNTPIQATCVATTTSTSVAIASVVSTPATARSSTTQPVLQPPVVFWPQNPISLYTPPSYMVGGDAANIRPPINITVTNASLNEPQVRISQSGLFAITSQSSISTVPAFTQGQLLHSTNSTSSAKDQIRPSHPTTLPSTGPHLPNSSPKPAILRRPQRTDNNITKKLVFETHPNRSTSTKLEHRTHNNVEPSNLVERSSSKQIVSSQEAIYSFIKPELSAQGGFGKPVVTSNGVPPANKVRNNLKDYPSSTFATGLNKDVNLPQVARLSQQSYSDVSVKSEPPFQHGHFKIDTAHGHITPSPFHPSYHLSIKPPDNVPHIPSIHHGGQPGTNKISIMQPRLGLLAGSMPTPRSPSLPNRGPSYTAIPRFAAANLPHQKDIKLEPGSLLPSSALKRDYDKISVSTSGKDLHHNSQLKQESAVTLSPRKKPRKQTHVVAEELPDTYHAVDDEISTDDADECEDEAPPPSSTTQHANKSSVLTQKVQPSDAALKRQHSVEEKLMSEYTDKDGVRYVAVRERPPITLLNGHRLRSACNHFNHYSDVKVKEKKVTLQDTNFNGKYLKGWKIVQFAAQLEELADLDGDILRRVDSIKDGLLHHVSSLLNNGKCDTGEASPAHVRPNSTPATPCSTPGQPKGFTSFIMSLPSSLNNNVTLFSSPLTTNEHKVSRLREEVLKVEDMAQANIQRCQVIQEQLDEAKNHMLKVLKQRDLAQRVVQVARETLKSNKANNGNSARGSKKKKI